MAGALSAARRGTLPGVVAVACMGPVARVVLSSLKTQAQIFGRANLIPSPFSFEGYRSLFTQIDVAAYLFNTLIYAFGGTFGLLAVAFLAAYPVASCASRSGAASRCSSAPGSAIPIAGLIVPEFAIMRDIGPVRLADRHGRFYSAMWFPLAFVILRVSLSALPPAIEEAAALDGARYFQLLRYVILPLARQGLAIAAILAGTTLTMALPIVTFVVFQRQVISGLTAGTTK